MSRAYSRTSELLADFEDGDEGDVAGAAADAGLRERPTSLRTAAHPSRDAMETREEGLRPEPAMRWTNPASLDAPAPRSGYVQRWVRDGERNEADASNWAKKMREGWRPRDPATVPQIHDLYPTAKMANGRDVIRIAGLVLCEMPAQIAMSRRMAVLDMTRRQTQTLPQTTEELKNMKRTLGPVHVAEEARTARGRLPATMASSDE